MQPLTQTILAVGVLTLVGMGGYVLAYGVPERQTEHEWPDLEKIMASGRLEALHAREVELVCQILMSFERGELTEDAQVEWERCLVRD
jgi:hypothetical protein